MMARTSVPVQAKMAATFTWVNNGTSGNWTTANPWTPAGPPTAGSIVSISAWGSTVTYNTTVSIKSLGVLGGKFSMTGGTLTVTDAASFGEDLLMSGAAKLVLGTASTSSVSGQFVDTAGAGSVSLGANASLTLSGGGSAAASAFTLGSGATLAFTNGFALGAGTTGGTGTVALKGGTLDLGGNAVIFSGSLALAGGTLSGTGAVTVKGSALFSGNSTETGAGTTELKVGGSVAQNGIVFVDGGRVLQNDATLAFASFSYLNFGNNSFTGTGGTLRNIAGATIDLQGDNHQFSPYGSGSMLIDNAGTFKKSAGAGTSWLGWGLTFNNSGSLQVLAGTLQVDAQLTNTSTGTIQVGSGATLRLTNGITFNGGSVSGAGTFLLSGGVLQNGAADVSITSGFTQSSSFVYGTGKLTLGGSTLFTGMAAQMGAGTTALTGAGVLDVNGQFGIDFGRVLEISGSLAQKGNSWLMIGANPYVGAGWDATLKTVAGGVLDIQADNSWIAGYHAGIDVFSNAGTLRKSAGAGTSFVGQNVNFSNSGAVQVQAGTLEFYSAFNNTATGTVALSAGASLKIDQGGTFAGGTVSGAGTLVLNPGTLTVSGATTISSLFTQYASTVAGTGTLTLAGSTTFLSSAAYTGSGTTSLTGTGVITSGAPLGLDGGRLFKVGGTLTVQSSGLIMLGYNPFAGPGTTATLSTTAAGLIDLQGDNQQILGYGSGPDVFNNAGTFRKSSGTGTSRVASEVSLNNTGTVQVQSGTLDIAASITGTGTLKIGDASRLELEGSVAAGQKATFTGVGGILQLMNPASFAGTIAGFDSNDKLDLNGFNPGSTTIGFVENAANTQGVLSVHQGGTTVNFTLLGQYAASGFATSSDGGGGTFITYTPPVNLAGVIARPH